MTNIINFIIYNSTILSESMKDVWQLEQNGFNYHILSIFGSQSTGKSK